MSNLTIRGNASGTGTVIVESPNTNTNRTITLPDATTTLVGTDATQTLTNKTINGGALTLMTAKAWNWNGLTTNTFIDFEAIPSWVKRITVMLNGVSTNGASPVSVRLGTSSGIESTGYDAAATMSVSGSVDANRVTDRFALEPANATYTVAGTVRQGAASFCNLSGNTWVAFGSFSTSQTGGLVNNLSGSKSLSGVLDRIRVTTPSGTEVFDAGTINVMYEG